MRIVRVFGRRRVEGGGWEGLFRGWTGRGDWVEGRNEINFPNKGVCLYQEESNVGILIYNRYQTFQ